MSETSNDKSPPNSPLRLGVIADNVWGAELKAYLAKSTHWQLIAAAGSPETTWPEGVPYYDDRRVMLAQSALDAVVVADSTKVGIELGNMAVQHGLPIWRMPPLGRNFGESCQQIQQIRDAEQSYCVFSYWQQHQSALHSCLSALEEFQPRFSEVRVSAQGPSVQSWAAGQGDAGGGVAILDAYEAIETLIALRGIPDNVSAATGRFRRRPNEAARETEDVATAIFRYAGGGVAALNLTWDVLPQISLSRHHSTTHSLNIEGRNVSLVDFEGQELESATLSTELLSEELDQFAKTIRIQEDQNWRGDLLDRHLAVTAVIEALYLSGQTWQPEQPRRLYEVQGWPVPRD